MENNETTPEQNPEKKIRQTTTSRIFTELLHKIESGAWPLGSQIPSERTLIEEFGVSRIALRESLSMLRVLGILDISHGRSTTVKRINAETLARLFPLMLTLDGVQAVENIFEVRLSIESQTAYYAAKRRSPEQLERIEKLAEHFANDFSQDTTESIQTDQLFHQEIAKATGNPLFAALLDSLGKIVQHAQRESGKMHEGSRLRAIASHSEIVSAIRNKDAEAARKSMIKHLQDSAGRTDF